MFIYKPTVPIVSNFFFISEDFASDSSPIRFSNQASFETLTEESNEKKFGLRN